MINCEGQLRDDHIRERGCHALECPHPFNGRKLAAERNTVPASVTARVLVSAVDHLHGHCSMSITFVARRGSLPREAVQSAGVARSDNSANYIESCRRFGSRVGTAAAFAIVVGTRAGMARFFQSFVKRSVLEKSGSSSFSGREWITGKPDKKSSHCQKEHFEHAIVGTLRAPVGRPQEVSHLHVPKRSTQ